MAFFHVFVHSDFFWRFRRRRRRKHGPWDRLPRTTFLFTETYIEKGQKWSKICHKYHLFMSFARFRLCLEYFVAEGDEITGRMPVYHERRAEGPLCIFVAISSPKATKSRAVVPLTMNRRPVCADFVAEGDIDGLKACGPALIVPIFRRRRRRNHGP